MGRYIILAIALSGLWLLLSGYFDKALLLFFGVVSVALSVWLADRAGVLDEEGVPGVVHLELPDFAGDYPKQMKSKILGFGSLLGLLQRDPDDWFAGNASDDDKARFDALAAARHAARQAKDWTEADRIRDEGQALGIVFEDGKDGTTWRKA